MIPRRSDRNMRYPARDRKANKKFQANLLSVSFNENVRERVFSLKEGSHKTEFVDKIQLDKTPFQPNRPKMRGIVCEQDISRREVVMLTGLEQITEGN